MSRMWSIQADAPPLHTLLSGYEGSWSFKGGGIIQHWHLGRSSNRVRTRPAVIAINLLTLYFYRAIYPKSIIRSRTLDQPRRIKSPPHFCLIKPPHSSADVSNCSGGLASGPHGVGSSLGVDHDDICLQCSPLVIK